MMFPEMRSELLIALRGLSDLTYQKNVWIEHQSFSGITHDEFDYTVHFIFDDTCLAKNAFDAIGLFLKNEDEAEAIRKLVLALEVIFERYGTELGDAAYIATPEWLDVLKTAASAYLMLSRNE
jgi:hypothetical protein